MSRTLARWAMAIVSTASVASPWEAAAGWLGIEQRPPLSSQASILFERVGIIDSPKRHTFSSYAKLKGVPETTIVKRYAATVVIRCNGHQATAQVTGAADILTTSAHVFFDRETCQQSATAKSCEITVRTSSSQTKYKGLEMVDYGYRKSLAAGKSCPGRGLPWGDDWAVLRLHNKMAIAAIAKDIKPYKLPASGVVQKPGEQVVATSGASLDFFDFAPDGTKFYPRNIQECTVKNVESTGDGYVETDCDTAELSSGGALLRRDTTRDTLIGIHMGTYESKAELTQALNENRTNTRPYKHKVWAALYVLVDHDFLRTLRQATQIE